jgi:hypothetical protein
MGGKALGVAIKQTPTFKETPPVMITAMGARGNASHPAGTLSLAGFTVEELVVFGDASLIRFEVGFVGVPFSLFNHFFLEGF